MNNNIPNTNGRKGETEKASRSYSPKPEPTWNVRGEVHVPERVFALFMKRKITPDDLRLLVVLRKLVTEASERKDPDNPKKVWASNAGIAEYLGCTPEHASARLSFLKSIGLMIIFYVGEQRYVEPEYARTAEERSKLGGEFGDANRKAHADLQNRLNKQREDRVREGLSPDDIDDILTGTASRGGKEKSLGGVKKNLNPPKEKSLPIEEPEEIEEPNIFSPAARVSESTLDSIPDGSLSPEQFKLLIEQQNAREGQEEEPPKPQVGAASNQNGKSQSHGQRIKPIPKGTIGGRGIPKGLKGDTGRDHSPAAEFARRLHRILQGFKKIINHPLQRPDFAGWKAEFEILMESKNDRQVRKALEWYAVEANFDGEFTPKLYCAQKFCVRFPDLEYAMEKEGKTGASKLKELKEKDKYVC